MRKSLTCAALMFGAAAFLVSCAAPLHVRTDYNRQAIFGKYRTFSFRIGNPSGNPVMDERIKSDVVSALRAKGLEDVSVGEGDAIVVTHTATRIKRTYDTFYDGWGWRWRWATPRVIVNEFPTGTVVVDIFDAANKEAIWHGYASGAVSDDPQKNAERTDAAIERMFQEYPAA